MNLFKRLFQRKKLEPDFELNIDFTITEKLNTKKFFNELYLKLRPFFLKSFTKY